MIWEQYRVKFKKIKKNIQVSSHNMRADNITIYTRNGSWGCRILLPLVISQGRTNELMKILIVFNLEVLLTAWDERNPCAVSRRKNKTVVELRRNKKTLKSKAGVEVLSSGQELECWSQSRSWKYPICFSEDPLVWKERWMMKEWFARHQWSINWMCSPPNG